MTYLTDPQARREMAAKLRQPRAPRERYNFWCVKQELAAALERINTLEVEIEAANLREQQSCGCVFDDGKCTAPCLYHHQQAARIEALEKALRKVKICPECGCLNCHVLPCSFATLLEPKPMTTNPKPEEIEALAERMDEGSTVLDEPVHYVALAMHMQEAASALKCYAALLRERGAEDRLVKDGWCWQYIDYDDWGPRYCWIKARATVQEISNPDRATAARLALAQMECGR